MKFKLLTFVAMMTAITAYSQGVLIWNIANSGGPTATAGGLIYTNNGRGQIGIFDGFHYNLGIEAYGGPDAGSLSLLGTFTAINDPKGYTGFDYGKFQAGNAVTVPGVASGGIAAIRLDIWYDGVGGLFQNYAQAALGGWFWVGSATFTNPTGSSNPPIPDQQMTGMPSIILGMPEPSTVALVSLGIVGLLGYRRLKSHP